MAENSYLNLTVLTNILTDPLIGAFSAYRNTKSAAAKANFLHELFEKRAEENFSAYVADVVMKDENAFSRACASGSDISPYLKNAYIADLTEIGRALDFETADFGIGKAPAPIKSWDDKAANLLYGYYQSSGYGKFIAHSEFRYDSGRGLVPVNPCTLGLSDLKGYEEEKAVIYNNLENFVKGLPCSQMLLYGDSGTGRSSTARAMANVFASQKLRLVELAREELGELPRLVELLSQIPLRFLVLIESLGEGARLPTCTAENVLVVATSHAPIEGFGLTVPFHTTAKDEYLAIVHELLKDFKLKISPDELETLSERWMEKNGLSPRSASLFVGYLHACQKKGKEFTF